MKTFMVAIEVDDIEDDDEIPDAQELLEGIKDGLPDAWFSADEGDSYFIVRMVCDEDWPNLLDAQPPTPRDAAVLDALNLLLSAPEWPGASGMEDVCELVRRVRNEIPNAPEWGSH